MKLELPPPPLNFLISIPKETVPSSFGFSRVSLLNGIKGNQYFQEEAHRGGSTHEILFISISLIPTLIFTEKKKEKETSLLIA